MIEIKIGYRSFRSLFLKKVQTIKAPLHWEDLSQDQLINIAALERIYIKDPLFAWKFYDIPSPIRYWLRIRTIKQLLQPLTFLREPEPVNHFIIKQHGYFAAADIQNITYESWARGEEYFSSYLRGKSEDLSKFIACFYYSNVGFQRDRIDDLARIINLQMADIIQYAIVTNYALIREWLGARFPALFTSGKYRPVKDTDMIEVFNLSRIHQISNYAENQTDWFHPVRILSETKRTSIDYYLKQPFLVVLEQMREISDRYYLNKN
jgi:hypothetical protein